MPDLKILKNMKSQKMVYTGLTESMSECSRILDQKKNYIQTCQMEEVLGQTTAQAQAWSWTVSSYISHGFHAFIIAVNNVIHSKVEV